jgi:TolB-like protein/DNA-binding winged helix-turn-helix (wHTH) protein
MIRFSIFEFDAETGELWKAGRRIRLQEQARQVLQQLLERPGELVTRDELRRMLWPEDTFVDFETGLNVVINKIRHALDDSASTPRFIETLPRRGYRFIAPITLLTPMPAQAPAPGSNANVPGAGPPDFRAQGPGPAVSDFQRAAWSSRWVVAASVLVLGVIAVFFLSRQAAGRSNASDTIHALAVIPFENLSADDSQNYLVDGITEALTTDLGSIHALRVVPRQSMKRYRGTTKSIGTIGRELEVDTIVQGSVLRSGDRVRLAVELIDVAGEQYRWTQTYEGPIGDLQQLQGQRRMPSSVTSESG